MNAAHVPLLDSAGDELRALLSPLTTAEFVRDYWAKKPLFVKGAAGKYAGFFDAETFSRVLTMPGPAPADFLRASFDRKTSAGTSADPRTADELRSSVFRANLDQAVALFDAGATLCVSQIETRVPPLVAFLGAIKRQLGYPGKVSFNAYLSPPGSGFNWHFDSRIASTLQIEGTKRWRFSNSAPISWPRANGSLRADGAGTYSDQVPAMEQWERHIPFDPDDTSEVELEPGDLLVLPAGTWHEACAGSGVALALNLTFSPLSYSLIVRNLLDTLLGSQSEWRAAAPVLPGASPGEVDPDGIAAITAQLAHAAEILQSVSGDSAAVVRLWEALVQNPNPGVEAPYTPPAATTTVAPAQRLRVRADGNFYAMLADGGTRLCLVAGTSRELELSGAAMRFVRRMLVEKEFVAVDCLGWSENGAAFTWNDVQTILTDLKREGLIHDAVAAA